MSITFNDQVAIVTGAGGGLGRCHALDLAKRGAKVVVNDLGGSVDGSGGSSEAANNVVKEITDSGGTAIPNGSSVIDDDGVKNMVDQAMSEFGQIDILINNAGFLVNKSFEDTTLDDFHNIYSTNVFSVAMLIKRTIKYMHEGSNVINISSIGGVQGSVKFPGLSAYSSSKGALNILTEMLAEEYKEKKVHFNSLALGSVQTKMLEKAFPGFKASTSSENMAKYIYNFATEGYKLMNGKVVSISSTTP